MSNPPILHPGDEKSPSAFQPPNIPQPPSSPPGDEPSSAVPAKGSSPPPTRLNSQTPPTTTPNARPGTPDFFLANSSYSMPGAYPVTTDNTPLPSPPATDPRIQPAATYVPNIANPRSRPSGKRRESSGGIRNLLASLRRPSGRDQPRLSDDSLQRSPTNRPETPSNDSMATSAPPLRKKMSGSFWTRRQSSLGTEVFMDAGGQEQGQKEGQRDRFHPSTPVPSQNGHTASPQPVPSPSSPKDPSEGGSIMNSIRKRKSGTFWGKRKSSLAMEASPIPSVVGSDEVFRGHARITSTAAATGPSSVDQSPSQPLRKKKSASIWKRKPSLSLDRAATNSQQNGNGFVSSPTQPVNEDETEDGYDVRMSEAELYLPVERSDSPPPKLPELNLGLGAGGGSGFLDDGDDDLFANIGKD